MSRRVLLLIVVFTLAAMPVRATIPLVLEQTISMPPGSPWDLQHWADPYSYGMAYIRYQTVYYAFHVSDSVRSFHLPDSCNIAELRLVRIGRNGQDMGVVGFWVGAFQVDELETTRKHYLSLINLSQNRVEGILVVGTDYIMGGYYGREWTVDVMDLQIWPPVPSQSRWALWQDSMYTHDYGGDHNFVETNYGLTSILSLDDSVPHFCGGGYRRAAIFSDFHSLIYATTGTNRRYCSGPDPGCETWCGSYMTMQNACQTVSSQDLSNCPNIRILGQQNMDGTKRIFSTAGVAYETQTLDTLWVWPYSGQSNRLFIMRVDVSANERIVSCTSANSRLGVFDAATGAQIDTTSAIIGWPIFVIKAEGVADRLVSLDQRTRILYIYRSIYCIDHLKELTCDFVPEQNILRLHWQEAPGAVRYWIYASATADGQYWPLDHVDASATSYDISPASPQRFFQVKAEYGQ
jgi:hypothetical protein